LEELGVFEVEDDIFENFDEENVPVIKNIYNRKKGSAEKLKTNQNARALLMSNRVARGDAVQKEEENISNSNNNNIINEIGERNESTGKKDAYDKFDEDTTDVQLKKSNNIKLN
jgi:hypothetical protein